MKKLNSFFVLFLMLIIAACGNNETEKLPEGVHKGTVLETIEATAYTYVKVKEAGNEVWIAVRKTQIANGTNIYYAGALEMKNFKSKDLDRTFDSIFFVQNFSSNLDALVNTQPAENNPHTGAVPTEKKNIEVEVVKDGKTIEQVYTEKENLVNKKIKVKGEVVKFNANIMGKNWVHIQDGSGGEKNFDLTITTSEDVKVGDVVVFEGILAVNKDFGSGYKYDVIIEEAKVINL